MNEVRTMTAPPDQISNVVIYIIPDKKGLVNDAMHDGPRNFII